MILCFQIVFLSAVLAVCTAGLLPQPQYSSAAAVSSQSIVRHDQPQLATKLLAAPALAYQSPVYRAAPAPITYHAAPAPFAYAAPVAKVLAPAPKLLVSAPQEAYVSWLVDSFLTHLL